jgi:hypothetical protein
MDNILWARTGGIRYALDLSIENKLFDWIILYGRGGEVLERTETE